MDIDKISRILAKNRDKNFVKRVIDPEKYPTLDNQDGTFSSHSMAWGGDNGKYFVYPTVFQEDDGKLKRYSPSHAFTVAIGRGDYIEFDDYEEADAFSKEYKKIWNDDFDPEGEDYDYQSALKGGLSPNEENGHWSSRNPRTGQLLKGRGHKTWDLLEEGEKQAGYEIYKGDAGRYYSTKIRN